LRSEPRGIDSIAVVLDDAAAVARHDYIDRSKESPRCAEFFDAISRLIAG